MKSIGTTITEPQWTEREKQLAEEFGVQVKTVGLIGKIVARQLGYHVGLLRAGAALSAVALEPASLEADLTGLLKFLDEYMSRETEASKLLAYVLLDLGTQGGTVAEKVRAVLRKHAATYIDTIGWEDQLKEDTEVIVDMHRLLDFWRNTSNPKATAQTVGTVSTEADRAEEEV